MDDGENNASITITTSREYYGGRIESLCWNQGLDFLKQP